MSSSKPLLLSPCPSLTWPLPLYLLFQCDSPTLVPFYHCVSQSWALPLNHGLHQWELTEALSPLGSVLSSDVGKPCQSSFWELSVESKSLSEVLGVLGMFSRRLRQELLIWMLCPYESAGFCEPWMFVVLDGFCKVEMHFGSSKMVWSLTYCLVFGCFEVFIFFN